MRYFLPDSRDTIDPTFDFETETRSPDRLTRDDLYCHEALADRPCDGILLSYAAVRGGVYPAAARRRLLRSGVREFFRAPPWMTFMGDPGAFSYVGEAEPPVTVDDVAEFYGAVGIDLGLSVDHIVEGYSDSDGLFGAPDAEAKRRYDLTLALARDFLDASKPHSYTPVGVVQGWSPESMAKAAADLQRMGYRYLAIGGVAQLKTDQLLRVLRAVSSVREPDTKIHLLGVTRPGNVAEYVAHGVASIDSTSPLRRAWTDRKHNYWIGGESYTALRIPQSISGKLRKRIASGEIDGDRARELEERALATVDDYAHRRASSDAALEAMVAYQSFHSPGDDRRADYQRTLESRPWERCSCSICARLGHHVIVFRGAQRNRSRGFHNVGQFYNGLRRELAQTADSTPRFRLVRYAGELLRPSDDGDDWGYVGASSVDEALHKLAVEDWVLDWDDTAAAYRGEYDDEPVDGNYLEYDVDHGNRLERWEVTFRRGKLAIQKRDTASPDLVLVGCGEAKRPGPCEARSLYNSSLFAAHWTLSGRYNAPVKILSALHKVLDPERVIDRYNQTLKAMSADDRLSWDESVAGWIRSNLPVGSTVVVLAGKDYVRWRKMLDGYEVLEPLARLPLGGRLKLAFPKQGEAA